tara:strand:- start:9364 stop:10368 length:1005 start_codon:yes stop_codon:yes gene_type:complete
MKVIEDGMWVEVEQGVWLPDLAGIVLARLREGKPISANYDTAELGKVLVRQLEEPRVGATGSLRLSSAGKCQRALAYDYHHYKPNGFVSDESGPIVFAVGDAIEMLMVAALHDATDRINTINIKSTGLNQETVILDVPLSDDRTAKIAGHPDGVMSLPLYSGEAGEFAMVDAILEIKSMSDYAFKRFRTNGFSPTDLYNYQTQAYQMAKTQMTGKDHNWTYVLALGKSVTVKDGIVREDGTWAKASPIVGHWVKGDAMMKEEIVTRLREVIETKSPEEIDRPYTPSTAKATKGQLRFPCDWCSHWKTCWPSAYEEPSSSGFYQKSTKIKLFVGE